MLALLSFYAPPSGGNRKTRWSIKNSTFCLYLPTYLPTYDSDEEEIIIFREMISNIVIDAMYIDLNCDFNHNENCLLDDQPRYVSIIAFEI